MKKYNVIIIGAGNIGAFYDNPASSNILTHAHAFYLHKGFNLIGFVDKDKEKAQKAAVIWGGKSGEIADFLKFYNIDVVCVATPDDQHYKILKDISDFSFKLAYTEKPLTTNLKEAEYLIELYSLKEKYITVNYSRRFIPEFISLKKNIEKGLYGKYLSGTGYYGKGLFHNGSHLLDLLYYFFNNVSYKKLIDINYDYSDSDPSVTALLGVNDKYFNLIAIDHSLFTIFEIDLIFEKQRIRIIDSGFKFEFYTIKSNTVYKEYRNLSKEKTLKTSLGKASYYAVENVYKFLTNKEKLKYDIKDSLKVIDLCTVILRNI